MGDIDATRWLKLWRWLVANETRILKWFCLFAGLLLVAGLIQGCATHGQPFLKEPGTFACVRVNWTEEKKIQNYCSPKAEACGTVGNGQNLETIWTPKPAAFDDFERVYKLGHEFLHSLGATHR